MRCLPLSWHNAKRVSATHSHTLTAFVLTKYNCVVQLAALLSLACGQASYVVVVAETLKVQVRETAGIRRFGYPIALALPELSSTSAETRFRLRDGEKRVPAQFRQEHNEGEPIIWWLDFNVSLMPNESRSLTLEYGNDLPMDDEPRGLELKQRAGGYEIRNGSALTWTLGRNLGELLKSVDAGDLQHVHSPGLRLTLEGQNGVRDETSGAAVASRVVRAGPLAVAMRYVVESKAGAFAGVKSTVDLTFPVSKSWVQVDWQIDDPRHAVESAQAVIAQNLTAPTDKEPTLIDFGAASLVYLALGPGTVGQLHARDDSWEVLRGMADRPEPFVIRPSGADGKGVEGWAHIMDRRRCLALALAGFGKDGDDSVAVEATGDVNIARKFAAERTDSPKKKSLRFWLHFVGFPPHVTAATSPQSMLSPLVVTVSKP